MQTQVEYGEVGLIGLPVELIVSDLNQELVEVEAAKDLICILILVLEMNVQVGSKYFFASPVLFLQLMILFLVLPPVDGGWGDWSVWSICGSDCLKTKYRSCDSPTPSNGGKGCQGFDFISTSCKNGDCSTANGEWSSWSSWSTCDSDCLKTRSRQCTGLGCQGTSDTVASCKGGGCSGKIYFYF